MNNQRKLGAAREFGAGGRIQRVLERVKVVENEIAELDAQLAALGPKAEPISLAEIEEVNRKLGRVVRETAHRCCVIEPLLEKWTGRVPAAVLTDESIDELVKRVEQRGSGWRTREAEMLSWDIEQFAVDEVELTRQIQQAKADSLRREQRLTEEIARLRIEVAQLLML
jgi:hypothetical protein